MTLPLYHLISGTPLRAVVRYWRRARRRARAGIRCVASGGAILIAPDERNTLRARRRARGELPWLRARITSALCASGCAGVVVRVES